MAIDIYTGTDETRRKARKAHPCDKTEGCVIRPGETYIDSVILPWTLIADDVDDYGHPRGVKNGEFTRTHRHPFDAPCNEDGMIDLYHRTSEANAEAIRRTGRWQSREQGWVFFSNRRDGSVADFGNALIHIRIAARWAELDDEFPDGEQHFRVRSNQIRAYMIVED